MVLPSDDDVNSFAFPAQSTNIPRGCWPSRNSIADFGYTAVDLISFSFCTAAAGRLQNRCSSRTGQVRQSSRIFSPQGARIGAPLSARIVPLTADDQDHASHHGKMFLALARRDTPSLTA